MQHPIVQALRHHYQQEFSGEPILIFAPGRINLIGEHTDYNNGFVFPAAIDKGIYLIVGKSQNQSTVVAHDLGEQYEFSISDELSPIEDGGWRNYVLGVIHQMKSAGYAPGEFNMVFGGDIPIGSGLSSSAALENAVGFGLNQLFHLGIGRLDLLKMSQKAEHQFAGVLCGIMDQFASMMGQRDKAILLDCQSLDYDTYPVKLDQYGLLLCNSNVTHNLAGSEYNVRRAQCEEGVALLQQYYPEIQSLRDVEQAHIDAHIQEFELVVLRRRQYVLEENGRVQRFGKLLRQGDLPGVGQILYQGHEGMKSDYEITCPEIDFMVDYAKSKEAVLGARMMGGGFGGCTINLIERDYINQFQEGLHMAYKERWGIEMTPIQVAIAEGVAKIE